VETPRDLDEQQAELLREFSAARGEDLAAASQDGRGLLGRLREAFGA